MTGIRESNLRALYRKKLIEVALPPEEFSTQSACGVYCIRYPFQRESDLGVTSVSYDLDGLVPLHNDQRCSHR